MQLVLHLTADDPALGEGAGRRIQVDDRLSIGRGQDNDLVLADPERHLSKNHCVIAFGGEGFTVTDTSTNGVYLDNQPERLPLNAPVPLREGSVLRLGGYRLTITAIAPTLAIRPPPAPRGTGVAAPGPISSDDGLFGDPLAGAPSAGGSAPGLPSDMGNDIAGLRTPFASPVIPEDIDLFGAPAEQHWHGTSQPDNVPSDQVFFAPPKVMAEKLPEDWERSAFRMPAHPETTSARKFGDGGLVEPPRSESAMPAHAAPRATPGLNTGADGAALATFLAAAGLAGVTLSDADKMRVMKLAGEALALALKGLFEVLAARASTKQEFRIERTTIGAAQNNPLKFSASMDEAVRAMLLGRTPGFLPANEAVAEAIKDIKSHQLAVLAGMQAALATVLKRFDPAQLELRLERGSLVEGIVPAARKARHWDCFKALYGEISSEIEDDFQKAFGAEFARAYRRHIERL